MSGLSFTSVATNSSSSVKVTISWERPSDRNGRFIYQLDFVGVQSGIYTNSNATVTEQTVYLNGTEDMYTFSGLPGAQYSVQMSAINCRTGLSSSEVFIDRTTVFICKSSYYLLIGVH